MSTTPYNATGRRKEAIAHAWLTPVEEGKSGKITINRRSFEEYLPTDALQNVVLQPFYATNTMKKYDVRIVSNLENPMDRGDWWATDWWAYKESGTTERLTLSLSYSNEH